MGTDVVVDTLVAVPMQLQSLRTETGMPVPAYRREPVLQNFPDDSDLLIRQLLRAVHCRYELA